MTAADTEPTTADDLSAPTAAMSVRARAERLLLRIADHGEKLLSVDDPLDVPDYILDSLVHAGDALVRLAELDAQQSPVVEIVLDGGGDLWVLVGEDQFECQASHDDGATRDELRDAGFGTKSREQVRAAFGIAREFVAAPRPAG